MSAPLTTSTASDTAPDADFDKRHEKELGAKSFVAIKSKEFFIPLGAALLGGVIGYFTLGKPIKALWPNMFGGLSHIDDIRKGLRGLSGAELKEALNVVTSKVAPDVMQRLEEARPGFRIHDPETAYTALKEIKNTDLIAIKNELNIAHDTGIKLERWAGAAALGLVGNIFGGIFVGYDHWKKKESTRLAASEIDRDISKLEVFSKRDPELVAENKRLRTLLAEKEAAPAHDKPQHTIANATHEGALSHHQQQQRA